jgi:transposase
MRHAQVRGASAGKDELSSVHANGSVSIAGLVKRGKRQRSAEEKRHIVEETLASGGSVTEVARAHGIRPNQVFKWRRLYRDGLLNTAASEAALLPVHIAESRETAVSRSGCSSTPSIGTIHIELANVRVRIEGNVDAATVRTVLECLAR